MSEPNTTPSEIWKPIPSTRGFYEASSLGRVRSAEKQIVIAGIVAETLPAKLLSAGGNGSTGYKHVLIRNTMSRVTVANRQYTKTIHRLVAEAFLGTCPCGSTLRNHLACGWEVNHENGDKHDNRPENLRYVTKTENHLHAYRVLGRVAVMPDQRGEKNPQAKLTAAQAEEIRSAYLAALNTRYGDAAKEARKFSRRFGITTSLVRAIATNRRWKTATTQ